MVMPLSSLEAFAFVLIPGKIELLSKSGDWPSQSAKQAMSARAGALIILGGSLICGLGAATSCGVVRKVLLAGSVVSLCVGALGMCALYEEVSKVQLFITGSFLNPR